MTNHYSQFSFTLDIKNPTLVKEMLEIVHALEDDDRDLIKSTLVDSDWLDMVEDMIDDYGCVGTLEVQRDIHLWIYAEDTGNLEALAEILLVLLRNDAVAPNYKGGILVQWAETADRALADAFSGGAFFVFNGKAHFMPSPRDWADTIVQKV